MNERIEALIKESTEIGSNHQDFIFNKEKFAELSRISILLNKTREEVARDNVTQAEVDKIMDHIDQRFNKLEEKIDRLIQHSK